MARAGYGSEQVNPGLLLVDKIYSYVQVTDFSICLACCFIRLHCPPGRCADTGSIDAGWQLGPRWWVQGRQA